MHKQTHPISCSLPASSQDSKKPSMACQQGADEPTTGRSSGAAAEDAVRTEDHLVPAAPAPPADDFEFCILSSGGLAPAGDDAAVADMCVADEVFSGGKLLPLRLSSAASADASTSSSSSSSGFSSRSVSRSSSCVSRSTSSSSASSDHAAAAPVSSSSSKTARASSAADAAVSVPLPPRRSPSGSGSVFYAHPSPSPQPPRSRSRSRTSAPGAARPRSTGSAPPASWGVIRLGVVGAPEVYAHAPRPARSRSRSASFEQQQHGIAADKKLPALGLLGAGLVCSCSPDAVAPVGSAEVAAAEARRRRQKKAEEKKKKKAASASATGTGTARRSRILEWLEDLSISKEKERRVVV